MEEGGRGEGREGGGEGERGRDGGRRKRGREKGREGREGGEVANNMLPLAAHSCTTTVWPLLYQSLA